MHTMYKKNADHDNKPKDYLLKDTVVEEDRPTKISALEFGVLDGTEMMRLSELHVTHRFVYTYMLHS